MGLTVNNFAHSVNTDILATAFRCFICHKVLDLDDLIVSVRMGDRTVHVHHGHLGVRDIDPDMKSEVYCLSDREEGRPLVWKEHPRNNLVRRSAPWKETTERLEEAKNGTQGRWV